MEDEADADELPATVPIDGLHVVGASHEEFGGETSSFCTTYFVCGRCARVLAIMVDRTLVEPQVAAAPEHKGRDGAYCIGSRWYPLVSDLRRLCFRRPSSFETDVEWSREPRRAALDWDGLPASPAGGGLPLLTPALFAAYVASCPLIALLQLHRRLSEACRELDKVTGDAFPLTDISTHYSTQLRADASLVSSTFVNRLREAIERGSDGISLELDGLRIRDGAHGGTLFFPIDSALFDAPDEAVSTTWDG